jgi:hypothetical protein
LYAHGFVTHCQQFDAFVMATCSQGAIHMVQHLRQLEAMHFLIYKLSTINYFMSKATHVISVASLATNSHPVPRELQKTKK